MRIHRCLLVILTFMLIPSATAWATVSLNISDNDATPTATTLSPGGQFTFTVRLVSTAETTAGIDYYLNSSNSNPYFSILDRNTAGSAYADPLFFSDAVVEASPSNLLNPRNDNDLGGSATTTNGVGTFLVANYTIAVAAGTPAGAYTITTTSNPNEGWIDPSFVDHPFNQHGSFTANVLPEPANLAVLGLALVGVIRRRRLGA